MLLENIWRRVVGNILMNISPSNISWNMLLAKRFHQNNQTVSAAVSINGLTHSWLEISLTSFIPSYEINIELSMNSQNIWILINKYLLVTLSILLYRVLDEI